MPFVAINLWCLITSLKRDGFSSVGRALVSKTRCREFESLNPCKLRVMNIVSYIKESFSELKEHVSWTALPELSNLTVVVLVFSLIFAGLIWLADSILSRVVKFYFDLIN